ncbi:MAG: PLDc N-terminal domain-containing protein [Actinobacteria bacterium]|nr:PLDc N-terminal domain-containing protein [Actinomycetota bacterium]
METLMAIIFGYFGLAATSVYAVFFMIWFYFIIVFMIIGMALFVFWIIALIDCIKRDNKDFAIGGESAKLIWILILILVRSITPVIYYLLIMKKKPQKKISLGKKK